MLLHRANPKEIPECGYFLIVLKHEGNMPFENDGLRWGLPVTVLRVDGQCRSRMTTKVEDDD